MSSTQTTFTRIRVGGTPDDISLHETEEDQIVYLGGHVAIHIPHGCDPDILTAISRVFARAGLHQTNQSTIKAVA